MQDNLPIHRREPNNLPGNIENNILHMQTHLQNNTQVQNEVEYQGVPSQRGPVPDVPVI